jgi:hypothetical protein
MANQTITTGTPASPINYDDASISGLLNGETITINGGALKIDSDVRWNQQAAVFGDIAISSSLGGSIVMDGTQVWEVPFTTSSGTVPTQAALGSNGVTGATSGATGELLRVFNNASPPAPIAAGAAFPASGFIKLRTRTGNFQAGEVINLPGGATITATNAGRRSWVHIVGRGVTSGTGSRITIPRLGTLQATGDWYELGTTNGTDSQTFQFPVADSCPAIWIETEAGSGIYEIWANAVERWTTGAVSTTDKRGMFFNINAATGVITIAERGTNNAGFKPPSGCKVRVPNVIWSNGDSTNYANNINPGSADSRYGFTSPAGGAVSITGVSSIWHCFFNGLFSLSVANSGLSQQFTGQSIASPMTFSNVAIVPTAAFGTQTSNFSNCYRGGTFSDCRFVARTLATAMLVTDVAEMTFNRFHVYGFGASGTNNPGSTSLSLTRCNNFLFSDIISIGTRVATVATSFAITFENLRYAVRTIGTTQTTDGLGPFSISTGTDTFSLNGFSNYENLLNVHSYGTIVQAITGALNISISNIGSPASPYDFGSVNPGSFVMSAALNTNITLRRVYTINNRIGLFSFNNAVSNVNVYNSWASDATVQAVPSLNTTVRGGRFTPSTTGQTNVYGTHWLDAWQSTTAGQIVIACNEPLDITLDQCSATLDTGNGSGFTSNGDVSMKQLTDVVTWTMPYFALGVTGFQNIAPTITGTNTANHTLEFQYDIGSGWNGTWLALTGANLAAISVTPSVGVRLQVRATVNTASTGNLLTYISIATTTTAVAQQIEYPLPGSLLTVNGLIPNSRVKVSRVDTGAVLTQTLATGTSLTFDLAYTGAVRIEARNASSATAYKPWVIQTDISSVAATTVTALQEID